MFNSKANMLYNGGGMSRISMAPFHNPRKLFYRGRGMLSRADFDADSKIRQYGESINKDYWKAAVDYVYAQDALRNPGLSEALKEENKAIIKEVKDWRKNPDRTVAQLKTFNKLVRAARSYADGSYEKKYTKRRRPTIRQAVYDRWAQSARDGTTWRQFLKNQEVRGEEIGERYRPLYYKLNPEAKPKRGKGANKRTREESANVAAIASAAANAAANAVVNAVAEAADPDAMTDNEDDDVLSAAYLDPLSQRIPFTKRRK